MRKLLIIAGLVAAMSLVVGAGVARADDARTLDLPRPTWLTDELQAKIVAAGPQGLEIPLPDAGPDATVNPDCLGTAPAYASPSGVSVTAVSAGTCMVSPAGCTMNFVFTDGTSYYIGTAGHCAGNGKTRIALVKIDPGFKVVPGVAGALGPTGVFCGDPVGQPVMHYGHGYIFFVEQGYAKFGEVVPDLTAVFKFTTPDGYNWVGYGLPGDSGSEVMNDAGLAVGDLTHGIGVAGVPVPGLNFGTDMQGIFNLIGTGYSVVTVDGRLANCANPLGI